MDRIEIRGLRAFGRHGVGPREQQEGQTFVVDVAVEVDLAGAARSDDLAETIDYGALAQRVADVVGTSRYDLIESLAAHLADLALEDPRARTARVRVAKPDAPLAVTCDDVAVVVHRGRG